MSILRVENELVDDVSYNDQNFKEIIKDLRSKKSFLQLEEQNRDQELNDQVSREKEESKSVLQRIAEKAGTLGSTLYVEYEDISTIKRNKREKENRDTLEVSEKDLGIIHSGGRPRKPEELKAKKFSVSFRPDIYEQEE